MCEIRNKKEVQFKVEQGWEKFGNEKKNGQRSTAKKD